MCEPKSWHCTGSVVSPSGQASWPLAQSHRANEKSGSCASSPGVNGRGCARVADSNATGASEGSCTPPTATGVEPVYSVSTVVSENAAGSPALASATSNICRCSSDGPTQRCRAVCGPDSGEQYFAL